MPRLFPDPDPQVKGRMYRSKHQEASCIGVITTSGKPKPNQCLKSSMLHPNSFITMVSVKYQSYHKFNSPVSL